MPKPRWVTHRRSDVPTPDRKVEPADLRECGQITVGIATEAYRQHQTQETFWAMWWAKETLSDLKIYIRQTDQKSPEQPTGPYSFWH